MCDVSVFPGLVYGAVSVGTCDAMACEQSSLMTFGEAAVVCNIETKELGI